MHVSWVWVGDNTPSSITAHIHSVLPEEFFCLPTSCFWVSRCYQVLAPFASNCGNSHKTNQDHHLRVVIFSLGRTGWWSHKNNTNCNLKFVVTEGNFPEDVFLRCTSFVLLATNTTCSASSFHKNQALDSEEERLSIYYDAGRNYPKAQAPQVC